MLIDSHCHLDRIDLKAFDGSFDNLLAQAKHTGVERILCVCITLPDFPHIAELATLYPEIACSAGIHPSERLAQEPLLEELLDCGKHPEVIAIGETGLDYHYNQGDLTWQQERFRMHIEVAKRLGKPLIIHSRDAKKDTLSILQSENAKEVGGIMHCFTEDWEMAKVALELGFYISFSGIITFKSAHALRDVVKKMPINRLLIETDAPYLAPMPHRGKLNHPALLHYTAACIADTLGIAAEEVAHKTSENYQRLFYSVT